MGFLRLSVALFTFYSISLARRDYLIQHRAAISDISKCANADAIADCLLQLQDDSDESILGCYASAGCDRDEAKEVILAIKPSRDLPTFRKIKKRATSTDDSDDNATKSDDDDSKTSQTDNDDAKETSRADKRTTEEESSTENASSTKSDDATTTTDAKTTETSDESTSASSAASSTVASSTTQSTTASMASGVMTGNACFTTQTESTEYCEINTKDGKTETGSCTSGKASSSQCGPNLICTTNSGGDDICMKHQDIQTEGIVIAIILTLASLGVIGGTFFACFKGSRKRKAVEAIGKGKDSSTASLIPK